MMHARPGFPNPPADRRLFFGRFEKFDPDIPGRKKSGSDPFRGDRFRPLQFQAEGVPPKAEPLFHVGHRHSDMIDLAHVPTSTLASSCSAAE